MIARKLALLLLILLLAACGGKPAVPPSETAVLPAAAPAEEHPPAAQAAEVEKAPEAAAAPPAGGPGSFDLSAPETGLEQLPSYQATLEMVFEGTQQGQPYAMQRSYTLVVDRAQEARLLNENTTGADGQSGAFFAGLIGSVRYVQPALDAPCQAALSAADPGELLEPARLLPRLTGAEQAGTETIEGIAAVVYTFDQRALGAGDQASASGKLWIAQDGGWLVKYELSMQSDTAFGEGILGEQRWMYQVQGVGATQAVLPESCPQALADLPVPEDAQGVARLPDSILFETALSAPELEAFYSEQLPGLGWQAQDQAPGGEGLWRWVYSRQNEQGQAVALITARAEGGGLKVRIYQVQTAIAPAQ